MALTAWITKNWFDLIQTVGIVGSLLFTAYTIRKDEDARQIGNSIAISDQHRSIWKPLHESPELSRVLDPKAEVSVKPVSIREEIFVTTIVGHLSTVVRAMKHHEFVKLEGLQKDVAQFFSLPIPRIVWQKLKPLQDRSFVTFVESCLRAGAVPVQQADLRDA